MAEKKDKLAGKLYTIGNVDFKLKELSMAEMETVHSLVNDNEVDTIKAWVGMIRRKKSVLLSIILEPHYNVSWFGALTTDQKASEEAVDDFFIKYRPIQYIMQRTIGLR